MRYSDTLMDYLQSPRNQGTLEGADRVGVAGSPGSGRYLVLHLQLAGDRVSAAMFQSHGCGVTIACGSVLTELVQGRTRSQCLDLTAEQVIEALDGLPEDKRHCAEFGIAALRNAWDVDGSENPKTRTDGR